MADSHHEISNQMQDALSAQYPIRVERDHKWWAEDVHGFVVGLTEKWLVIQSLTDAVYFDGCEVVRIKDVTQVEDDRESGYIERAVAGSGRPDVSLDLPAGAEAADVLRAAAEHSTLLSIFIEKADERACLVGHIERFGKKKFDIQLIGPKGVWEREATRWRYKDVTRIEFGDRYAAALEQFGEIRPVCRSHTTASQCTCD